MHKLGQSLRRGGMALGQLIGGYFGVTEDSQMSANGWNEMGQRRAEVRFKLVPLSLPPHSPPPPLLPLPPLTLFHTCREVLLDSVL